MSLSFVLVAFTVAAMWVTPGSEQYFAFVHQTICLDKMVTRWL